MNSNTDFTPADQVINYNSLFRLHDAVELATQEYISLVDAALYNPDDSVAQEKLEEADRRRRLLKAELRKERADLGLE